MSTTTPPQHHHTYWCHECELTISLPHTPRPRPSPHTPPRCPHCHSDFLEQMDSFTPQFPNPNNLTPSDDNFLLTSPYLHRLIHHLTATNASPVVSQNLNSCPAAKSAVEALEIVKISNKMLENDPVIPCPVCKENFVVEMEVKMLPCKHLYHTDCILPWLELNNSCPVCRFQLPTDEVDQDEVDEEVGRRESFIAALRLHELLAEEEEDLYGFRRSLRRVARSHHLAGESGGSRGGGGDGLEFLLSPTQIGQAGPGGEAVARANSVETVSSWPVESVSDGEGDTFVRS